MSTSKPRITITLEKQQYDVLSRLSKANRQPMSRIVTELLEATVPYLQRAVVVVEQAAKLRGGGISEDLRRSLDKAESEAMVMAGESLGKIDLLLDQESAKLRGGEGAGGTRSGRPAPSNPRTSNDGGQVMKRKVRPGVSPPALGRAPLPKRGKAKAGRRR